MRDQESFPPYLHEESEEKPRRKLIFDPTINLGHILTFISLGLGKSAANILLPTKANTIIKADTRASSGMPSASLNIRLIQFIKSP